MYTVIKWDLSAIHPKKLKSWTDISVALPVGKWTKTDVNRSGRSHVRYIILLHMHYLGLQKTLYSYMIKFFKNACPLSLSKYCTKGLQLIVGLSTEKTIECENTYFCCILVFVNKNVLCVMITNTKYFTKFFPNCTLL